MEQPQNGREVLKIGDDSAIDSRTKRQQNYLQQSTWRANNPEKVRAIRIRYEKKHADKRRTWHQTEAAKSAARTRVRLWKAARHQFVSEQELRQCRADMRLAKKIRGPKWIVCLECGRLCKVLNRHLPGAHQLIVSDYRARWGYRNSTGLISDASAQKQRENVEKGLNLKPKPRRGNLRRAERWP
jgi:predicted transcriptional regulator